MQPSSEDAAKFALLKKLRLLGGHEGVFVRRGTQRACLLATKPPDRESFAAVFRTIPNE
jgi:hypothetical protein